MIFGYCIQEKGAPLPGPQEPEYILIVTDESGLIVVTGCASFEVAARMHAQAKDGKSEMLSVTIYAKVAS